MATDRVKELQNQPGPLSEEQKQELAACQAALARLQQETTPPPQAADGGTQDSNLVPVGGGDGGKDSPDARAATPPAPASGNALGAVGETMYGPASSAHASGPQASAVGSGASGGPVPTPPSQPQDPAPAGGGQDSIPANGAGQAPQAHATTDTAAAPNQARTGVLKDKHPSPANPTPITDGSDIPPMREGEKIVQSSKYWYIFEHKGTKYVRFFAPEARSPNGAKKGGRGDGGGDNGSALLTPEGRIYVEEGQHRLNGVVLEGTTNLSSVPGHPKWLEFKFGGNTDTPGEPPAYSEDGGDEPWVNVNKLNPWDGEEGY